MTTAIITLIVGLVIGWFLAHIFKSGKDLNQIYEDEAAKRN